MRYLLKAIFLAGLAASAASTLVVTNASAAPAAAVYTTLSGQPAAVVPVYYKCTKKGCGYFFYRKYGTPVTYPYPVIPSPLPILGSILSVPSTLLSVPATTATSILPALSLGFL